MEELKRFHGSTVGTIPKRKLIEDRDTILELTSKIQELQNEINCMNDSRDFQDAESVRSGQSHVASQPVFFPPHPVPGGMLSRSIGMPSRRERPPSIWDKHGISGNVFANPTSVFFVPLFRRIQSLDFYEINCMSDSKDFQDAESIRSGNSHVTSRPVSFPPHPFPEGMLRHSFGMPSRREGPPSIWGTHGISGIVF